MYLIKKVNFIEEYNAIRDKITDILYFNKANKKIRIIIVNQDIKNVDIPYTYL